LFRNHKIKAIIFDLDGTLRHSQPSSEKTFFKIAVELGANNSRSVWLEGLRWAHEYWAQSEAMLVDYETYSGLTKDFWINYARRHLIAYNVPEDQAESLSIEIHKRLDAMEKPQDVVFPETFAILSCLRDKGYTLGIVSNRTYSYLEQLENLKLSEYMSCTLAAGEVGLWKPDPEIFKKALGMLALEPGEAVFVGDNYYTDVVGSRNAGMHSILLDPEGVFPDPGCPIIRCISELKQLVE
jgi:HAD superfamily hydrolase (TIGR01509 family)